MSNKSKNRVESIHGEDVEMGRPERLLRGVVSTPIADTVMRTCGKLKKAWDETEPPRFYALEECGLVRSPEEKKAAELKRAQRASMTEEEKAAEREAERLATVAFYESNEGAPLSPKMATLLVVTAFSIYAILHNGLDIIHMNDHHDKTHQQSVDHNEGETISAIQDGASH